MHRNYSQYRKRFSQNFINSGGVVKRICAFARVESETVLEIGAGKGMLTRELARRAGKVIAVELDRTLAQKLDGLALANVEVMNADFLELNLSEFRSPVVIGNLPYAITAKIIEALARQKRYFNRAVLTVQREYGMKMLARPGDDGYDPMSIYVNYHFLPGKGFIIPAHYFNPRPRVDSMVVSLEKKTPEFGLLNESLFFEFVRGIFHYRRKQVRNALRNYLGIVPVEIDLDLLTRRPEELSARDFHRIYMLASRATLTPALSGVDKICRDCGRRDFDKSR
jgi:16S rRNA (adenine1518-N6/adenine1519-N6)-dimethyltransferase